MHIYKQFPAEYGVKSDTPCAWPLFEILFFCFIYYPCCFQSSLLQVLFGSSFTGMPGSPCSTETCSLFSRIACWFD